MLGKLSHSKSTRKYRHNGVQRIAGAETKSNNNKVKCAEMEILQLNVLHLEDNDHHRVGANVCTVTTTASVTTVVLYKMGYCM